MTQGIYSFPYSSPDFSTIEDKSPPCSIEAEEAVLGAILFDPAAIYRVKDRLKPEHFYVSAHQHIYQACVRLCNKERSTDLLSVTNWLTDHDILTRIGGKNKLATVFNRATDSINIDSLAALIIEKAVKRELIHEANEIIRLAYKPELELPELSSLAFNKIKSVVEVPIAPTKDEFQRWKHDRLLKELTGIYTTVPEPSLRFLKLKDLADDNHVSMNFLELFYLKSLTAQCSKLLSYDELKELAGSTVREWLLNGLVPKSTTILLASDGGVGKTKFIYGLGKQIIQGQQFGQFHATGEKRKILYYQGDESPGDMMQALDSLGYSEGDINKYVKVRFGWSAENMPALIQDLKEFRPDFVVIDSLSTANRFSTYQESQMEYARPILEMTGLAHEYGCTFVIIHHTNRDGGVRGTTAIRNAVSEVWQLTKDNSQHSTPNDRLLEINKSRSRSSGKKYRMIFNPEDLSFTFLGEEETGETTGLADKTTQNTLLDFFANNRNTKYTSEELAHITGYSKGNVRRCLGLLSADGLISRQPGKPNLYFLAMEGSDPQVITDHTRSHHDHLKDHTKNPELPRLTDDNDHAIAKNAPVENFTDQQSCDPEPPNDHCGLEALQNKDLSCDPSCDHQVISDRTNDHCGLEALKIRESSCDPQVITDHTSDQQNEQSSLPLIKEKCKYWSKSLNRGVEVFTIFDVHSEASCRVPGRGTVSLPFSDLSLCPQSPKHDLAVGDEVVILVGKDAETFAVITDIREDGIFLKGDKGKLLGRAYYPHQLVKTS